MRTTCCMCRNELFNCNDCVWFFIFISLTNSRFYFDFFFLVNADGCWDVNDAILYFFFFSINSSVCVCAQKRKSVMIFANVLWGSIGRKPEALVYRWLTRKFDEIVNSYVSGIYVYDTWALSVWRIQTALG